MIDIENDTVFDNFVEPVLDDVVTLPDDLLQFRFQRMGGYFFCGYALDKMQEGLAEQGCEVPVIDPPAVAVKLAEGLVDIGLAHSKRTYPLPPDKEIVGYP